MQIFPGLFANKMFVNVDKMQRLTREIMFAVIQKFMALAAVKFCHTHANTVYVGN